MMKYKLLGLLCGMLLFAGCFHEDDLKPLGVEEPFLSLPQGDNDYDDRIMQLFTDYGVSIFYKFEPKDVYFNYTGGNWLEAVPEHTVAVDGKEISLSLKEFELLLAIVKADGRVCTRDWLLENVWGYSFDGESRTVDVHIRKLRAKLGEDGNEEKIIETVKGIGYKLKK